MFKSLSQNLGFGDLVADNSTESKSTLSSSTTSSPNMPRIESTQQITLSPLINSEEEHPDIQDEQIMKNSKFKSYREDIISVLKSFDNTREWADLIKCLQKMKKVLTKNAQLHILPEKITVCKRLAQCLNPALPGGVHLKTLETYEEILKLITVSVLNFGASIIWKFIFYSGKTFGKRYSLV